MYSIRRRKIFLTITPFQELAIIRSKTRYFRLKKKTHETSE